MPSQFNQVAVSIEMLCNVKNLTVDDLVGWLRVAEDQFEDKIEQITDKAGSVEPMAPQVSPSIIF